MSELNRREFVIAAASVCAAGACGMCMAAGADAAEVGGSKIDVGTAADYAKDGMYEKPDEKLIVVRSGDKIYALSNVCSHKMGNVKVKGEEIVCPKHNSKFAADGKPKSGPAKAALFRHGISTNAEGHLIVDTSKKFGENQWNEAAASVTVKA